MNCTLCGASWYTQKYYLNPAFARLPEAVRQELQILAVSFTEDVGGIFTIDFEEDRLPHFSVRSVEGDSRFDEIGAELKIRKLQREKEGLLEKITLYYRIAVLGESAEKAAEGLDLSEILERIKVEQAAEAGLPEGVVDADMPEGKAAAPMNADITDNEEEPYISPFQRLAAADVSFAPIWPDDLEDET